MLADLSITDDAMKGMVASRIPNQRLAGADDVATLALYLASDESSYSTGSEFVVDGGLTAGMGMS